MANPIPYTHIAPNALQQRQQEQALAMSLRKNDTTLVAMTSDEFLDYALAIKESQGMSRNDALSWIDGIAGLPTANPAAIKHSWDQNKGTGKEIGSYLPVFSDARKLTKLASDLHKGGGAYSKYRVNYHGGKAYVVIAGYAGLRQHLTASHYLANNPKVVSMGIGKLGAADTIRSGFLLSVIFSVAFHSLDQMLNDSATWHTFLAGVTVDVVSAVTGGAIAWGVTSMFIGGAAMAAVGPILLVVIAGAAATWYLNDLASQYQVAERMAVRLIVAESRLASEFNRLDREIKRGLNHANEDPVGFMHKLFGVPYFGRFQ
ncbi:hypothetical protein [Simiduia aestuariiviva]|uniref:Uncharacterized protein n=1 Tax=Simiduia aestuariiviva TaxID=1510459 RepID=A0A839UKV7_9GAMM|nr:hypothetical protein [Simiduia aestuariiviva]MBB3167401.1 hypothetical protein [Simiduia aestuariiviva]